MALHSESGRFKDPASMGADGSDMACVLLVTAVGDGLVDDEEAAKMRVRFGRILKPM